MFQLVSCFSRPFLIRGTRLLTGAQVNNYGPRNKHDNLNYYLQPRDDGLLFTVIETSASPRLV